MLANLRYVFTISIFFMGISLSAQHIYWQKANNGKQVGSVKATNSSNKVHYFQLNHSRFQKELQNISLSKASSSLSRTIDFPHPEKGFISFTIAPYAIMEDALTQKFPEIQTYVGTNQNNKIYFSFSSKGLQATCINTQNNTVLFYQKEQKNTYAIYRKGDKAFLSEDLLNCSAPSITEKSASFGKKGHTDGVLRTFRLAISASGEYTSFHGGTKAEALAAIVATLTRVNALLEQELAVRLLLVGTNDRIIFTDAATDPYSGNLSGEVQTTIDTEIGNNNYDIGHLFHQTSERNDGNSGFLGSVCQTGKKGSAYVVHKTPVGDVFDIDYVLHEMGHQFGANHTWSYAEESSGVQVEPGSGSTIMGYAGISGSNNLQSHSDPYFHHSSLVQMQAFLNQTSCGQTIALSNNKPEIVSLKSYVVPPSTPFVLEATASDADGDLLTYSWEQIDDGVITNFNFGPTNILGANFRSIPPSTNSMRYFPRLAAIAAGGITQTNPTIDSAWETAASVSREFNFACTVRDNQSGGGQWVYETLKVQVDDSQPVFAINSQNSAETWLTGSVQSIQWAVGNTRNTPFNIEKVSIHLSTDGGNSFPIVLASNVPNTGSYPILVPAIAATSNARILIRAKNHIIFA
ncbi:MAG: M12 family metallo-peptidase, partial [Flavobacteriaceae bacterium]|nr:M12 family metallo-peptidase [Flavobacteriaceae bacterium]